ncbi:MAG TPA: hypothetical protein VIL84_13505 [Devosiaceae bacterium]
MTQTLSLLQNVRQQDIETEPFPHVVVSDVLPEALYRELAEKLPEPSALGVDESRNNSRWDFGAAQVAKSSGAAPLWKEFIRYHASDAFFRDVVGLFFDSIHARYPQHFPSQAYMDSLRVGTRFVDNFRKNDILMDAMISGNTPVHTPTSVRRTHIDNGSKLFSGLFYMRRENDDSEGGDLQICRFLPHFDTNEAKSARFNGAYVKNETDIEVVKTIKYSRNCLVLFINTIDSLHGVTVRQKTGHGRYFVNLVGETITKLYRQKNGHPVYLNMARPITSGPPPISVVYERIRGRTHA